MPKKTKKQKLLAELRRKLATVSSTDSLNYNKQTELVKRQNDFKSETIPLASTVTDGFKLKSITEPKSPNAPTNYSYVRHDLIRITIFTFFALASQGVLYFFLKAK
jgi:NifB/MoaA-like Fe-S oxidoreductase